MYPRPNSHWRFPGFLWYIGVALLVLCFISLTSSSRLRPLWQLLDAGTTGKKPAIDLRLVLTAVDCYRQAGFRLDETLLHQAATQDNNARYIYPAAWLGLAYIPGINAGHTVFLAAVLYVLFGFTLGILFRKESGRAQLLIFLALLSPSILLLCERANTDMLIFCIVAWAALLLLRTGLGCQIMAAALLLAAAFLKIYPIAASVCLLSHWSRRCLVLFAICIVGFSLRTVAFRSDVSRVMALNPQPTHLAYGAKVLIYEILGKVEVQRHAEQLEKFRQRLRMRSDYDRLVARCGTGIQIVAAMLCGACGLAGMRASALVKSAAMTLTSQQKTLFLAGSCIYAATFIANNNWCYRLVFLILCMPALAGLANSSTTKPTGWFLSSLLCAIIVVCWITPIYEPLEYFIIHNMLHWLIACGLCFVAGGVFAASSQPKPAVMPA